VAVFFSLNVTINFRQKSSGILSQDHLWMDIFFRKKYFKNHNIDPETEFISFSVYILVTQFRI
jgi:hypothetical protein